jgi:hypothetical protein
MYAALMVSASIGGGSHIHEVFAGAAIIRGLFFLGLAFAVALGEPRFDRAANLSVGWFALFGAIAIGGQLWQRHVDDGTGSYILIDPVFFGFTAASEALLVLAGLLLLAIRRGAP